MSASGPPPTGRGHASDAAARRWAEVRAAAEAALARPVAARAEFLDHACGDDAVLRAEVDALVEACERAARSAAFLDEPAAAFIAPLFGGITDDARAGYVDESASARAAQSAAVEDALRAGLAGRYDVERELGRGGMATVYLARDLRHERRVAVKVLDPAVGVAMSAERFLREIRVTAGLTHPHILPLHESGESGGLLYYVMPYLAGETLRARLAREGALPATDAVRVIRELADALAHAHGHGVMHRDLKPENVLLSGGHAVVADFGIAKALAAATRGAPAADEATSRGLTSVGVALGTPAYMAPEQAVADAATDHRADLYALGVIAYEVLAGAHPFNARTPQALVAAHLTETPTPLESRRADISPALASLVLRLLAKDPADRPQSADEVVRALDAGADSPSIASSSVAAARRSFRTSRRGALLALTTLIVLAATVAGYGISRRTAPRAGDATRDTDPATGARALGTLAVLPFVNTSGTTADDYFSDGMTDELAHALASIPGLHIAGRTSSYTFKGKSATAQEIGRVLDVAAFVSGTVRRAGERLRVTTQLVSTRDGKVLWDSVYESRSGDVFAVQDSLTRAVVAAMVPALGARGVGGARADPGLGRPDAAGERGTRDQESYELYLKARYYWHERGAENVAQSITYFQQAIARDPTFARAYAGLSLAYNVLAVYVSDPSDSTTPLMAASARRAMTLDSTLADAQLATALVLGREFRFADAEAHYRAALRIEPQNPYVHQGFGATLLEIGRTEESIAELRLSTRLDPLAKSAGTMLAEAYIDARRFREAKDEANRVLAIDSTFSLGFFSLGLAQAFGGQPDSAVRTLERGVRLYPALLTLQQRLLFAYAAAGRWTDVERMRAELRRAGQDHSGGALTAFADFLLGDHEALTRLVSTRAGQRTWSKILRSTFNLPGCNPLVDPLWSDAGYRAAMRGLGMAPCPQARPWPLPARPGA